MEICSNALQLRNALKKVKPSKIAVAFVGNGWEKFISPEHLEEIILSPTLGSNPKAIEAIMNKIGASNVHFLDNLHSKIYLGETSALVGSPNLSNNGFADRRLFETSVVLSEHTNLEELRSIFNDYVVKAKNLYKDIESKEEKLRVLTKQWQSSIWHNLNTEYEYEKSPPIANFRSNLDRIHIVWYQQGDIDYNEEVITETIPNITDLAPDDYFSNALQFLENDPIQPGDWILHWRCRNDGYPHERGDVSWVHVHHVIPNGANHEHYTMLVGQADNLSCPAPPFALDTRIKKLIRDTLSSGDFNEFLCLDNEKWELEPADAVVPKFLEHIQRKAQ